MHWGQEMGSEMTTKGEAQASLRWVGMRGKVWQGEDGGVRGKEWD
jgi:hypothetical protein